jgi:seryl-tRNA(Sec) selenium transferase
VTLQCSLGAERLAERLRAAPLPVIARLRDDALVIDTRTLLEGDEDAVEQALGLALRDPSR